MVSEQSLTAEAAVVTDPAKRYFAHLLAELSEPLDQEAPRTSEPQVQSDEGVGATTSTATQASRIATDDVGDVPSWQASAPKAELYVPRDAESATGTSGSKEQYPKKFMEIIEFIQTGKPIEGIRIIPDTVIEDPSISTTGKMQAPLKPWERRAAAAGGDASPAAAESA